MLDFNVLIFCIFPSSSFLFPPLPSSFPPTAPSFPLLFSCPFSPFLFFTAGYDEQEASPASNPSSPLTPTLKKPRGIGKKSRLFTIPKTLRFNIDDKSVSDVASCDDVNLSVIEPLDQSGAERGAERGEGGVNADIVSTPTSASAGATSAHGSSGKDVGGENSSAVAALERTSPRSLTITPRSPIKGSLLPRWMPSPSVSPVSPTGPYGASVSPSRALPAPLPASLLKAGADGTTEVTPTPSYSCSSTQPFKARHVISISFSFPFHFLFIFLFLFFLNSCLFLYSLFISLPIPSLFPPYFPCYSILISLPISLPFPPIPFLFPSSQTTDSLRRDACIFKVYDDCRQDSLVIQVKITCNSYLLCFIFLSNFFDFSSQTFKLLHQH